MSLLKTLAIVLGLIVLFTEVEFVTLYYWLQYGNSFIGLSILQIGLLLEHAISVIAGVIAGMASATLIKKGLDTFLHEKVASTPSG